LWLQKFRDEAQKTKVESERLHNLVLEKQVDVEMHQKELETQKVEIENLNQKVYEVHFI
jgi:nucleoprotein TPR